MGGVGTVVDRVVLSPEARRLIAGDLPLLSRTRVPHVIRCELGSMW